MCARIKVHTCIDSVNTKTQCKNLKEVLNIYYMTECLKLTHIADWRNKRLELIKLSRVVLKASV
jgi:hypothetical protein